MTRQARQDQAQDVVLPSQPSTRPWPPPSSHTTLIAGIDYAPATGTSLWIKSVGRHQQTRH